jgi:hypothetical protein
MQKLLKIEQTSQIEQSFLSSIVFKQKIIPLKISLCRTTHDVTEHGWKYHTVNTACGPSHTANANNGER